MSIPQHHRAPTYGDFRASLRDGWTDFRAAPAPGLYFAVIHVILGGLLAWITYVTGTTYWLVLGVLGFPLVGVFTAAGFYETSRRLAKGAKPTARAITRSAFAERHGQMPWLAVLVVVILLFWFFLGHMIFALFLGVAPMTHIMSSMAVVTSGQGLAMLAFGTAVGAVFATLTFAISVLSLPLIMDRDVDFISAMLFSLRAVAAAPIPYLAWGAFIAITCFIAMIPAFLGLLIAFPVLGHATWHLYQRVISPT